MKRLANKGFPSYNANAFWEGGDTMTMKSMVNELVEIGFENATKVLSFSGFTPRNIDQDKELNDTLVYICGLSIDEGIKDELIRKMYLIEEGVFDRVCDSAEEYFRAGVCFVLNFLFDANNFQKNLESKLNMKKEGSD